MEPDRQGQLKKIKLLIYTIMPHKATRKFSVPENEISLSGRGRFAQRPADGGGNPLSQGEKA
jgi:hypothetical protein